MPTETISRGVCVSPGLTTALVFDKPIDRERVGLDERDHFTLVDVGERSVLLMPGDTLSPGTRLWHAVYFMNNQNTEHVLFSLTVHPSVATRQVEVSSQPRTEPVSRAELNKREIELRQCREEFQQCREELQQLRTMDVEAGSLANLFIYGLVDENRGITSRSVDLREVTLPPNNTLQVWKFRAYRSIGRVAMAMRLFNLDEVKPWKAAAASLMSAAGQPLEILRIWQPATLFPSHSGRVVVEAAVRDEHPNMDFCTLTLWDATKERSVTITGVLLPD